MTADRDSVVDIEIRRGELLRVEYADGVVAEFPVAELRIACPCASCRGWRERGQVPWPRFGQPATISIADAELTGAWGLSIRWSDGHDTGIYAWSVLRRWWDSGLARPMVIDPRPPAVDRPIT
ncbi:MAG: DUF971 domain-containing protein [Ilumatobacteraceae bacterium]